ncbi:TPA: hypothetical protein EYN98_31020 [Candidatus Poribacteria bacterium]|nr:hypothetical protein [Candidatus Poribacteria bacterium]HIB88376.1 hypothetical protein [Candidatus Poribacteria bacterium]HIC02954.1 hypothetical protein [Candidatus Poribacteria bacterium]HIM09615.1 hypothetical protein [Candidatus Poribacteria bacterium]HIN30136.1 hypothetical protein [Candidatus Poribacteria bacterium]
MGISETSFSFYATKNLATGGGGMIITNNDQFAKEIRVMQLHGIDKDAWERQQRVMYGIMKWFLKVMNAI